MLNAHALLWLAPVTLPLLLAVQRTKGKEDLFWDRVITKGERTPEDFTRARELILGTGAVEATLDALAAHLERHFDTETLLNLARTRVSTG